MSIKVLIVGANGFIGSNLSDHILAYRDWDVTGVDLSPSRLERVLDHERFHWHRIDILEDPEAIDALVEQADAVLPLAAIATPISYVRNPLRVFELTFEANLRIVRSCVRFEKRVIFPSSSEVYGMSEEPAFEEETTKLVLGPIGKHRWIYSCAKQMLDRVIHAYGFEQGLRYTIFRPFNWIGPRLDSVLDPREGSSRVVTQFIGNIVNREDLRIVDGGGQRRCLLYIDDAIDALVRIIENRNGCADQGIFNIGNPDNDISIRELATRLIRLISDVPGYEDVQEKVRCVDVAAEDFYGTGYQDIHTRTPSILKSWKTLGWKPTTDITTALRRTIDFYLSLENQHLRKDEGGAESLLHRGS